MPIKHLKLSRDQVRSIADGLKTTIAGFEMACRLIDENRLDEVFFEWSDSHWKAFDKIFGVGCRAESVIEMQLIAILQERPSTFEEIKKKSKRDMAQRRKRDAARQLASGIVVQPKKRGRPRKVEPSAQSDYRLNRVPEHEGLLPSVQVVANEIPMR